MPVAVEIDRMSTEELRRGYLVDNLFAPGEIRTAQTDLDGLTIGGAMPLAPLQFSAGPNRELGIINLGDAAKVRAGDRAFLLGRLDCLYAGAGEPAVTFEPATTGQAAFYFASCPSPRRFPSAMLRMAEAETVSIGDRTHASERTIRKFICPGKLESHQLVMGFTELHTGAVWNTMPPHTHTRRSEIYLYFDLDDGVVTHLMGQPDRTRHLLVRDRQAVLSPRWSIHSGAGTKNYRFVWAMAGENRDFADIDPVSPAELR
jgi:4-deoxy-L-threo-5-hexosulose-uronate ketol-isomerase